MLRPGLHKVRVVESFALTIHRLGTSRSQPQDYAYRNGPLALETTFDRLSSQKPRALSAGSIVYGTFSCLPRRFVHSRG